MKVPITLLEARQFIKKSINQAQLFLESTKGVCIIIICILFINIAFYNSSNPVSLTNKQKRKDASGFSIDKAKQFAYFHYYTGYFPLATLNKDLKYSVANANQEIKENGNKLIMEYQHWSRLGEHARIWAFLPNAILSGSPENPSIKLFNTIIFTLSLIILYLGFWRIKHPFQGLILVLLINLTPFYLYETFVNQNIFALLGSVFFTIIGLNIFILYKKASFTNLLITALISGMIIGLFSEFRNEVSVVLASLFLTYFLAKNQRILVKVFIVLMCFTSFYGSKKLIRYYFDNKFEETAVLVEKYNGHVYNGKRVSGHILWHPVFCGLGDFDKKYGYEWDDRIAYKYATPILQEKYGMKIKYSDKYHLDNYYDKDSLYYVKFDEIDEYELVIKEKIISQISDDPLWYASIIIKRIIRTLSVTTPIKFIGWLIFYVFYFFIKKREWFYLKLIIISLPLSATSILIYSGKGATYNSVFVYFIILSLLVILKQKIQFGNKSHSLK